MSTFLVILRSRGRRLAVLAAFASLFAGAAIAGLGVEGAEGKKALVLGKSRSSPQPSCPDDCLAVGSVSSFQIRAGKRKDGKRNRDPFKLPVDAWIVAWSVDLSNPKKSQRQFFGETFRNKRYGRHASARISVLRKTGKKNVYQLSKKSPGVDLAGHYGQRPIFTLDQPIKAKKGRIVALTTPTWIPALAIDLPKKENQWRGSRDSGECGAGAATDARPQEKLGSKREYGCKFTTTRPLYWVYYVER
jgi:hypothetical protein